MRDTRKGFGFFSWLILCPALSFQTAFIEAAWAEVPTVAVVRLKAEEVSESLTVPGSLEPYEMVTLHSKVTGFVRDVHVEIGDRVRKGDLLVELDIPEMEPDIRLAEAEIESARALLQKAEADFELSKVTARRLAEIRQQEPGAIPEQDVDVAMAQMKITAARAEIARAGLKVAQAKLARLKTLGGFALIRVPFNGTVTKRYVDSGALVTRGTDTPVLDLVRTDRFRVTLDVPETLVPHVLKGSTVGLSFDAFPGRVVEESISRVAGVLIASTRRMRAEVDLENDNEMYKAGMYCSILLRLNTIPDAFSVPATAVRSSAGKSHVLSVQDERIGIRPVSILMDDGKRVVIAGGGIEPGMPIVVSAPAMLEAGQLVKITDNGAKTP